MAAARWWVEILLSSCFDEEKERNSGGESAPFVLHQTAQQAARLAAFCNLVRDDLELLMHETYLRLPQELACRWVRLMSCARHAFIGTREVRRLADRADEGYDRDSSHRQCVCSTQPPTRLQSLDTVRVLSMRHIRGSTCSLQNSSTHVDLGVSDLFLRANRSGFLA